eukprot:2142554-Pyramimonas_sp.AAC.1
MCLTLLQRSVHRGEAGGPCRGRRGCRCRRRVRSTRALGWRRSEGRGGSTWSPPRRQAAPASPPLAHIRSPPAAPLDNPGAAAPRGCPAEGSRAPSPPPPPETFDRICAPPAGPQSTAPRPTP